LAFGGDGVFNPLKPLLKRQSYRPPIGSVAIERARLVFADATLQAIPRPPDMIRAVTTEQDVKNSAHIIAAKPAMRPSRRRFAPPQDEEYLCMAIET
jgi:hypothetical protein